MALLGHSGTERSDERDGCCCSSKFTVDLWFWAVESSAWFLELLYLLHCQSLSDMEMTGAGGFFRGLGSPMPARRVVEG